MSAVAWIAAIAVPVMLWQDLARPADPPPKGPPTTAAADMDKLVTAAPFDVLVLGDSSAELGIDATLLGPDLADPAQRVLTLARSGGSTAPTWYSILKDRVYGNGAQPRLVVLGCYLSGLVATQLDDDEYALLAEQIAVPDDVLAEKTWRTALPTAWDRAAKRAAEQRDAALAAFRARPVAFWYGASEAKAARAVTYASTIVFGGVHGAGDGGASIPGDAPAPPLRPNEAVASEHRAARTAEQSYLPAIAALVAQHGGKLVIVLPPTAYGERPEREVPAELGRGMAELAGTLGVGWLDERDRRMDIADFADSRHLNRRGSASFTHRLASRLKDIGAIGTAPLAAPVLPPVYTVTREGTAPVLTASSLVPGRKDCAFVATLPGLGFLSQGNLLMRSANLHSPLIVLEGGESLTEANEDAPEGCFGHFWFTGDEVHLSRAQALGPKPRFVLDEVVPAIRTLVDGSSDPALTPTYWIYPGTTLTIRFDEPWRPVGPTVDLDLDLDRVDPVAAPDDAAGDPVVTVLGQAARLVRTDAGYSVHACVPSDSPTFSLTIAAPPGGHYVVVQALSLSQAGERVRVVRPPFLPAIDALAKGSWTVQGPIPRGGRAKVQATGKGAFWAPAPFTNAVGCTPLRVTEGGRTFARPPDVDGYDVTAEGGPEPTPETVPLPPGGAVMHIQDRLWLATSDDSDPTTNHRAYAWSYDAERKCPQRECPFCPDRGWLYPGDRLSASVPADAREVLPAGVYGVNLTAAWDEVPAADAVVHVHIEAGGVIRYDGDVPVQTLGERNLPVRPALQHGDRDDLLITVDNPTSSPPLLLTAWATQD